MKIALHPTYRMSDEALAEILELIKGLEEVDQAKEMLDKIDNRLAQIRRESIRKSLGVKE